MGINAIYGSIYLWMFMGIYESQWVLWVSMGPWVSTGIYGCP